MDASPIYKYRQKRVDLRRERADYHANRRKRIATSIISRLRTAGRLPDGFFDDVDPDDFLTKQAMCRALQWIEKNTKGFLRDATPEQVRTVAAYVGKRYKRDPPGEEEDAWEYLVAACRDQLETKDANRAS